MWNIFNVCKNYRNFHMMYFCLPIFIWVLLWQRSLSGEFMKTHEYITLVDEVKKTFRQMGYHDMFIDHTYNDDEHNTIRVFAVRNTHIMHAYMVTFDNDANVLGYERVLDAPMPVDDYEHTAILKK